MPAMLSANPDLDVKRQNRNDTFAHSKNSDANDRMNDIRIRWLPIVRLARTGLRGKLVSGVDVSLLIPTDLLGDLLLRMNKISVIPPAMKSRFPKIISKIISVKQFAVLASFQET
jgi:hypothetical protein